MGKETDLKKKIWVYYGSKRIGTLKATSFSVLLKTLKPQKHCLSSSTDSMNIMIISSLESVE